MKAPHFDAVYRYAKETSTDEGICELTRLSCKRFLNDLEGGQWDFDCTLPEFCIEFMTGMFVFAQAERLDGTPLRGKPYELLPWQMFSTYNITGFLLPGTKILRFKEANAFCPRKTVKTLWSEALLNALVWYFRMSGAKGKTVAGSLKQGLEGFNWVKFNYERLGLIQDGNPKGVPLSVIDSSLGHTIKGKIWDGYIELDTLAFKPDLFDSFNAQFVHLDELELYKNSIPYNRLRDASKAFTNKLIICTFTAGDDGTGFAAQHKNYLEGILRGTITGPDADRTFAFMAEAPKDADGSVDFTNPAIQRAANPAYGITIRPEDMLAASLQAKHKPMDRKEFLTRSLNVFVSSYKAWFDLECFRRSDRHYDWTLKDLAKIVPKWYGGADLSKLHDLTAAVIAGEIPVAKAKTSDWTPPEDVLVIIPHCWFPIIAAAEKADQDQIPLFGWQDDGWLTMPNTESMDPTEPVKQFKKWRELGFKIWRVGQDRKFARRFCQAMKDNGFKIVDQPQYYLQKSEGFRYIEHKAKIGCLYYLHAEPYEYCVSNVKAAEKVDDAVQFEKLSANSRIDVFDASVFAVIRMLIDSDKMSEQARWFGKGNPKAPAKEE